MWHQAIFLEVSFLYYSDLQEIPANCVFLNIQEVSLTYTVSCFLLSYLYFVYLTSVICPLVNSVNHL